MKTICIDFDGVLHSYSSGWGGPATISDPPVSGAIDWLRLLIDSDEVEPVIYSSRSKDPAGIQAMRQWLCDHGLEAELLDRLSFPTQKPAAFLTIDDRAICFDGAFPSIDEITSFTPWYLLEGPLSREARRDLQLANDLREIAASARQSADKFKAYTDTGNERGQSWGDNHVRASAALKTLSDRLYSAVASLVP